MILLTAAKNKTICFVKAEFDALGKENRVPSWGCVVVFINTFLRAKTVLTLTIEMVYEDGDNDDDEIDDDIDDEIDDDFDDDGNATNDSYNEVESVTILLLSTFPWEKRWLIFISIINIS